MDIITLALAKKQIGKDTTKAVSDYLDEHLTNPTNPPLDTSLEIAGAAADSKATGDKLSELKEGLSDIRDDLYTEYKSKNLINPNQLVVGRISQYTGEVSDVATNFRTTEFIPIEKGKKYILARESLTSAGTALSPSNIGYGLYDTSKIWITDSYVGGYYTDATVLSFTASSDGYVRISGEKALFTENSAGLYIFQQADALDGYEEYYDQYYEIAALTEKNIVQTSGTGTDVMMSQKAVTDYVEQSMGNVEDVVDLFHRSEGKNKYNPQACNPQNGYRYGINDGILSASAMFATTGKIPVEPSTQYIFSAGGVRVKHAVYFSGTDGETFISGETIDDRAFTTPSECTFVAINLFAASHTAEQYETAISVAQLELGDTATSYEPFKNRLVMSAENVESDGVNIGDKIDSMYKKIHGKNLYDKTSCNPQNGKSYSSNGTISDNALYAITGKIPCDGNTVYTFSAGDTYVQYVAYFSGETFLSREQIKGASFTTPEKCDHVGFNLFSKTHTEEQYQDAIDSAQLEVGTKNTEYEAFQTQTTEVMSNVVQGIGNNVDRVMSQDAVTKLIENPQLPSWWSGKKGDSLGDSITAKFNNFQKFVERYLGLSVFYNNGKTGTKMSGPTDPTWGDSMWMDSRINALHADADFITILGGANDSALVSIGDVNINNCDVTTYAGAFNVVISKIYYRFLALDSGYYADIDYSGVEKLSEPHNILLLPCTMFYVPGGIANLDAKANAIRTLSKAWALKVVDFNAEIQANPFVADVYWSQSDRVHPTELFYKERLAPMLVNALINQQPLEYDKDRITSA